MTVFEELSPLECYVRSLSPVRESSPPLRLSAGLTGADSADQKDGSLRDRNVEPHRSCQLLTLRNERQSDRTNSVPESVAGRFNTEAGKTGIDGSLRDRPSDRRKCTVGSLDIPSSCQQRWLAVAMHANDSEERNGSTTSGRKEYEYEGR